MPSQNEIRKRITNQIVQALSQGGLPPWRIPWRQDPNAGFATNVVSRRKYSGINPLILQLSSLRHSLTSKWWGTSRQWDSLGASVMRRPDNVPPGEWGTAIVFWKPLEIMEEDDKGKERKKTIFMLKTYTVFNLDQVRGECLDHLRVGHSTATNTDTIITYEQADKAIAATGAVIKFGGNRAFYHRKLDYIQVPCREQFSAPEFYETVLHECVHWTEQPWRWTGHGRPDTNYVGERNG